MLMTFIFLHLELNRKFRERQHSEANQNTVNSKNATELILKRRLKNFQIEGINFLIQSHNDDLNSILVDDMVS